MERLVIKDNRDLRDKIIIYFNDAEFRNDYPIGTWITSEVTNMSKLFAKNKTFNENIGGWDTSNVTDMSDMFYDAEQFNQNISNWNTSNVTSMKCMFMFAKKFNQPINTSEDGKCWNVSKVTNMKSMFEYAEKFNQDISNWNVSNVTNMNDMFYSALSFDKPINDWTFNPNVSMENMFFIGLRFRNNPRNYIYNMSEKIDSIVPAQFKPMREKIRKKMIQTYFLDNALRRTNIGSKRSPQNPTPLSVVSSVGDYLLSEHSGGKKTRKRRIKRKTCNRKINVTRCL